MCKVASIITSYISVLNLLDKKQNLCITLHNPNIFYFNKLSTSLNKHNFHKIT